jgi:hypothetical protein
MKPWVDVQGSGNGVTVITYSPLDTGLTGIIRTADHTSLSDLTVENDSLSGARAIDINGGSPILRNVQLRAIGHNLPAVAVMVSAGSPTFDHVTIFADSPESGSAIGLSANTGSNVTIRGSEVNVPARDGEALSFSPGAKAVIADTTASATTMALYAVGPGTVVDVRSSDLTNTAAGAGVVVNMGSQVSILNSNLTARGQSHIIINNGVLGAAVVQSLTVVDRSNLNSSSREVLNNAAPLDEMRVATSELAAGGGVATTTGITANVHCIYSYRPDMAPLSASCN